MLQPSTALPCALRTLSSSGCRIQHHPGTLHSFSRYRYLFSKGSPLITTKSAPCPPRWYRCGPPSQGIARVQKCKSELPQPARIPFPPGARCCADRRIHARRLRRRPDLRQLSIGLRLSRERTRTHSLLRVAASKASGFSAPRGRTDRRRVDFAGIVLDAVIPRTPVGHSTEHVL